MPTDLQQMRRDMKRRRAALPAAEIASAAHIVAAKFWSLPAVQRVNRIGIYMAVAGEVDCAALIKTGWLRKKRIFAPVLAKKRLKFAPLVPGSKLVPNRFGIFEPAHVERDLLDPKHLDAVVVPLLAFDENLNRVGMGAGFYDRTFAFSTRRSIWRSPLLVGLAYSFQRVDTLHAHAWDVPLHRVITEQECFGGN